MTEENPTLSVTLLYVSGLHTEIKGRDWENGGGGIQLSDLYIRNTF